MTLDLTWARSMRPVSALPAHAIDTVVIVGPSGAGKSTLVDAVRDADVPGVDVPMRYSTRPPRATDSRETSHLPTEQFAQHVRDGSIVMHWTRTVDGGRVVRYGFAAPRPDALAVLSANSAILLPAAHLEPASALEHSLVVGVVAPRAVREARLARRASDLDPAELHYRLSHDDEPDVHVVIENHGVLEPIALTEIVELVARLAREAR
jgi:ribose 1,5-bisphosphokinase PhnN